MRSLFQTIDSKLLTFERILLAVVFFPHGAQKVFGWFGGHGFSATMHQMSQHLPAYVVFLVMIVETLGALGLFFGFLGRIGAFGILCVMIGAILTVHLQNGFFMNWMGNKAGEGFEYHLLAIGLAVPVLVNGSGAYSIDEIVARRLRVTPRFLRPSRARA